MHRLNIILLLLTVTTLVRCSMSGLTGGGSDLPDKVIAGRIVTSDNTPATNTQVVVIPSDYNSLNDGPIAPAFIDTTDSGGNFSIGRCEAGSYSIQAVHLSRRTRLLISGVMISRDTTVVPEDSLRVPGVAKVYLPDGIDRANCWVYVPGTTIAARNSGMEGYVVLDSVPAGTIPSVCYMTKNDSVTAAIRYGFEVASGDTALLAKPAWHYSRRLHLNTSASGAQVDGTVVHFPVLVRLTEDNFDFSQALPNGEDLRFTIADTSALPYEIECWDPVKRHAEVWVRVDTVYGNRSDRYFTIYWGNPSAISLSDGVGVFDTASGFSGVWHLGEKGDSVRDATDGAFNGKNSGSTTTAGIIGNSRNFSNGNYIRISGLLNSPSDVTLSAWVRSDTSKGGQDILSIGDAVLIRLDDVLGMGTAGCYHNTAFVSDSSYAKVNSGRYLAKTGWHYLVFSINAAMHAQALYIDGAQGAISHDVNPINYSGLGGDTYLGIHGNGKTGFNFIGQIDEVRVNSFSVASDWIKLCYMNQKEQDALIRW
jgi:hypothetical protein